MVLAVVLSALPCQPTSVGALPIDGVSVGTAELAAVQARLDAALHARLGRCLQDDAATQAGLALADDCPDDACVANHLGVRWVLSPTVVALHGRWWLQLALFDLEAKSTSRAEVAAAELGLLDWEPALQTLGVSVTERPSAWRWAGVAGLAGAAVAGSMAIGWGHSARVTSQALSVGNGGCPQQGDAYLACLDARRAEGREAAATSTAWAVVSAVLAVPAAFALAWSF